MDIYVYEHFIELDHGCVEAELKKRGMLQFFENIRLLSECRFGTKPNLGAKQGTTLQDSSKRPKTGISQKDKH